MPTQSLQGGIHGGFPSSPPRRSRLDDMALGRGPWGGAGKRFQINGLYSIVWGWQGDRGSIR